MDGHLRRIFREHLRAGWDWQSIETWGVGAGVPDGNFCSQGTEGWVEFKACRGWRVPIDPTQVAWIERRCRAGGRVFVAVRKDQSLFLFPGLAARRLLEEDFREVDRLGDWHGGPARWDWAAVGACLVYKAPQLVV